MSQECSHDCNNCGAGCPSNYNKESMIEHCHPMASVKNIIGVISGKGGVGKSMVTSMLAVLSRRKGLETAVLDADVTGPSVPRMFGIQEKAEGDEHGIFPVLTKTGIQLMSVNLLLENETDPVVWRGPVIAGTVKQFWTDVVWKNIDFMYVDMPPGTGDVPLTVFQSMPMKGIIVVTSPQELVSMIVEKAVKMANMMHIPVLGIVENMSYFQCPDCGKSHNVFGNSHVDEIAARYGIQNVAKLPIDPALASAGDKGMMELFSGNWLDSMSDAMEVAMMK
ncbi:MAG TPA: ATP-binding protein [Clostridiales bacterium]|nr:ATP-binding protein [Clostridiales bacterium]